MFGLLGWQAKLGEYLIVIAVFFGIGYYVYDSGYKQCTEDMIAKQAKADKIQQDKYNTIAQELEDTKKNREDNVRTITKTVSKIIEKPVYTNNCLDNSGLSIANQAISGRKIEPVTPTAVQANSGP